MFFTFDTSFDTAFISYSTSFIYIPNIQAFIFDTFNTSFDTNFVTFSPYSNNKFLKPFIVLELDIWSIKLSSCQTATGSCIREKMNTITEEQLVSWNRNSVGCIFDSNTLRQESRAMNLNPIVEYENPYLIEVPLTGRVSRYI